MASANAKFFCSTPYAHGSGSKAHVLVSPGHYGTSIASAHKMAEQLRSKLREAQINFTDAGDSAANMEIGNTNWDMSVMRINLQIEMPMAPDEAKAALKEAGFFEGLPDRF